MSGLRWLLVAVLGAVSSTAVATTTLQGLANGLIKQGPYLFCGDEEGMMHLLYNGRPLIHDMGVFSGLNDYTKPRDLQKVSYIKETGRVVYRGKVRGQEIEFEQSASVVGSRIRVAIRLHGEWPEDTWGSFQILLPVSAYGGAAYRADGKRHEFPAEHTPGHEFPGAIRRLECHLGEPSLNLVFECEQGLGLGDHRRFKSPFYVVSVSVPKEHGQEVEFFITLPDSSGVAPRRAVRWSHIGYPLAGEKVVILEWPKGDPRPDDRARLENRKNELVNKGRFGETEAVDDFQDNFATFDFSDVRTPGEYRVVWSGGETGWFPIKKNIFGDRLWQPTLDYFIPFEMCHAQVKLGDGVPGHPKCHVDDGSRVDAHFTGPDGFFSYECEGTPYQAGEYIPVARGGWHDAGDYDLNVPAQAYTVWMFALAHEEFTIDRDVATLNVEAHTFRSGKPDGVPDIVGQIEWGVLWLLSVQQKDGRVYNGVCANDAQRFGRPLGQLTDGKPGTDDDRRVYVDYHADVQLNYVIGMAAASRVLKRDRSRLADRCLEAARKAFRYFQKNDEVYRSGSYAASGIKGHERDASVMAAAIELYLTTGKAEYLHVVEQLAGSLPELNLDWPLPRSTTTGGFRYVAPFLARLHPKLPAGDLKDVVTATCRKAAQIKADRMAVRPWPLNIWHSGLWGNSTTSLARAFDTYWLTRVAPDLLAPEAPLRNMLWIFGMHPTGDTVLVCGLGYPEPQHLYSGHLHALHGFAPSSVPGAVVPGMGGFWYSGVVAYIDEHGYYGHNEGCIYTQALYIFAVNAMKKMGF